MEVKILRFEGLSICLLSLFFYFMLGGSLPLLLLLLILPDVSMIGYIKDAKVGAFIYNTVHNHIVGIVLIFLGVLSGQQILILSGIGLHAHVGIDRFFGFGLKLPSGFTHTHLGKILLKKIVES